MKNKDSYILYTGMMLRSIVGKLVETKTPLPESVRDDFKEWFDVYNKIVNEL